jgi:ribosome-binding protein aMBF1 (putative translation factor)
MITNEREYQITREEAGRFAQALAELNERDDALHPLHRKALRESIESQLHELQVQLTEYETRQVALDAPTSAPSSDVDRVAAPSYGLAGARIRAGLSLHDLAVRMNVPDGVIVKLQRGRIDPRSLPDRFAAQLSAVLGVGPDEARALAATGTVSTASVHLRTTGESVVAIPTEVISFRDALLSCGDELTPEQQREWLDQAA